MTIPTRLSFKQQQMPDEISYKQSRKYSTKNQALIAIFFVICFLIYAIPKHNPRFVNSTFEVEIMKEVSTSKVKLYGLKPQRLATSVKVKPEKAKPEQVKPKPVKPEKSKPEQAKLEKSKPEKVKPEKPKSEKAKPNKPKPEKAKKDVGGDIEKIGSNKNKVLKKQDIEKMESINNNVTKQQETTTNMKYILEVTTWIGSEKFKDCKSNTNCYITTDENYFGPAALDKFDAVVLKPGNLRADKFAKVYAEKERSASQRYIFRTVESPRPELKGLINEKYFSKRFFNWTWTYRADSEITESYGYLVKHEGESHPIDATRVGHYKSIELDM